MQSSRAGSTRTLYDAKWRVFERWCQGRPGPIVPYQASLSAILSFLQDHVDKGQAFSTIKGYLAAISACHIGIGGDTIGSHPMVRQFMKGVRRLRPVDRSKIPLWDVNTVLEALSRAPFEPLEAVDLKYLFFKTAIMLALTTTKRVSDLHALSVAVPECLSFAAGDRRVTIKPNPAFIPKNFLAGCKPVDLVAYHPPPFTSEEDKRLNLLCPVRALRMYVDRTAAIRSSSQLFVSWGPRTRGKPITKVRLSQWLVEAISLAYTSKGLQPPVGLRAHYTRSMSASWALCRGVSIQDVCAAASWASPSTCCSFYSLDVADSSLAHAVLGVASR